MGREKPEDADNFCWNQFNILADGVNLNHDTESWWNYWIFWKTGFQIALEKKKLETRSIVKAITCHHKKMHFNDEIKDFIYICDKNDKECLIEGQCPNRK